MAVLRPGERGRPRPDHPGLRLLLSGVPPGCRHRRGAGGPAAASATAGRRGRGPARVRSLHPDRVQLARAAPRGRRFSGRPHRHRGGGDPQGQRDRATAAAALLSIARAGVEPRDPAGDPCAGMSGTGRDSLLSARRLPGADAVRGRFRVRGLDGELLPHLRRSRHSEAVSQAGRHPVPTVRAHALLVVRDRDQQGATGTLRGRVRGDHSRLPGRSRTRRSSGD